MTDSQLLDQHIQDAFDRVDVWLPSRDDRGRVPIPLQRMHFGGQTTIQEIDIKGLGVVNGQSELNMGVVVQGYPTKEIVMVCRIDRYQIVNREPDAPEWTSQHAYMDSVLD